MNGIGGFLCELSMVERVQPEALCHRIEVLVDTARLHLADGQCEVELDTDRRAITAALRQVTDLVDPILRRAPASARCNRSARWAALLKDLGVHYPDMVSICRARTPEGGTVRYHRIEHSGPLALITVADGRQRVTRTFDLDAGPLSAALPVEIADSLSPPADPPTHWGPPPPRTGAVRTWMRRLSLGP